METKIRVGAVSYLNTKPLVWGFEQGMMKDRVQLIFDYPANLASALHNHELDVALLPVAAIPELENAQIISDFCIGATGPVASVCLFSEVPIQEIETIYLDYQSRTSVALLRILLKEYWKINPKLLDAFPGYENKISSTTAGLIIGDRAFDALKKYSYCYDLAEAWQKLTGLPFVFAAWIANTSLPENFIQQFNVSTGAGFSHLQEIVEANSISTYNLMNYYSKNIDYKFSAEMQRGLKEFLLRITKLTDQ